jgi:lysozyme family protein
MKWILGILFVLHYVFSQIANTAILFKKYELYDTWFDKYKMGFSTRRIKNKINEVKNPEVKKKLQKSLFYEQLSNWTLLVFFVLFLVYMIYNILQFSTV